jgi:hypothetical protein
MPVVREEIHSGILLSRPDKLARIPKHQRLEILRRLAEFLAATRSAVSTGMSSDLGLNLIARPQAEASAFCT